MLHLDLGEFRSGGWCALGRPIVGGAHAHVGQRVRLLLFARTALEEPAKEQGREQAGDDEGPNDDGEGLRGQHGLAAAPGWVAVAVGAQAPVSSSRHRGRVANTPDAAGTPVGRCLEGAIPRGAHAGGETAAGCGHGQECALGHELLGAQPVDAVAATVGRRLEVGCVGCCRKLFRRRVEERAACRLGDKEGELATAEHGGADHTAVRAPRWEAREELGRARGSRGEGDAKDEAARTEHRVQGHGKGNSRAKEQAHEPIHDSLHLRMPQLQTVLEEGEAHSRQEGAQEVGADEVAQRAVGQEHGEHAQQLGACLGPKADLSLVHVCMDMSRDVAHAPAARERLVARRGGVHVAEGAQATRAVRAVSLHHHGPEPARDRRVLVRYKPLARPLDALSRPRLLVACSVHGEALHLPKCAGAGAGVLRRVHVVGRVLLRLNGVLVRELGIKRTASSRQAEKTSVIAPAHARRRFNYVWDDARVGAHPAEEGAAHEALLRCMVHGHSQAAAHDHEDGGQHEGLEHTPRAQRVTGDLGVRNLQHYSQGHEGEDVVHEGRGDDELAKGCVELVHLAKHLEGHTHTGGCQADSH
mmetsp:Transcript_17733/g.55386  ORF Transcript_17733/g.55386 Transcript_17733/m.55386 type:complete len:586 (-) Transcript_17733:470-2227(-)